MYFHHFDFIGFVIPLLVLHMLSKSFGYFFVQKNQFSVNLADQIFAKIREFFF